MNKKNHLGLLFVLVILVIGCGSSEYEEGDTDNINYSNPNGPGATVTPVPIPPPDVPIDNLSDPIPYDFSLQGTNNSAPQVKVIDYIQTDSILRVKVTARDGGRINVNGYGYAPMYNCAKFTVRVAGRSWTTKKLKVSGSNVSWACSDAVDSDTVSFDTRVANSVGPFKVEVTNPLYDHYCSYFGFSCPLRIPYFTHQVHGHLDIQTNSTTGF